MTRNSKITSNGVAWGARGRRFESSRPDQNLSNKNKDLEISSPPGNGGAKLLIFTRIYSVLLLNLGKVWGKFFYTDPNGGSVAQRTRGSASDSHSNKEADLRQIKLEPGYLRWMVGGGCECLGWAWVDQIVRTRHHRNCRHYDSAEEIRLLEEKVSLLHNRLNLLRLESLDQLTRDSFRIPQDRAPEGFQPAEAYIGKCELVVMGDPDSDPNHNCDEMGCSSISHVRFRLLFDQEKEDQNHV